VIEIFDVICIGAALVDMVAQVTRYPADDDEVFVSDLTLLSGGAAANTAYACAKIGLSTAFIGKLGGHDAFGNKILNDFKEVNVDTKFIKYSEHHGTGSAYIALNKRGDRRIYAHSGAANYLSKEDLLEKELINTKIIFLSSLKNLEPFIEAAIIGRNNKIPVVLNPGMLIIDQGLKNIKKLLEKIDLLILSQNEYASLFNIEECDLNEDLIQEKSSTLFKLGIQAIITTLGKKGALLLTRSRAELLPPLKLNSLIDTTGAGDAFSAGFIYGLVQNINLKFEHLKNNVKIGNFVAGNCIQELGARNGIPNREDLIFFLDSSNKKI
jgi:ribokinase